MFPIVFASVFTVGQDISLMETCREGRPGPRLADWLVQTPQRALLDPANIALCGAHREYSKVEITIVLLLPLSLLWPGILWVFSVRCETLNSFLMSVFLCLNMEECSIQAGSVPIELFVE